MQKNDFYFFLILLLIVLVLAFFVPWTLAIGLLFGVTVALGCYAYDVWQGIRHEPQD